MAIASLIHIAGLDVQAGYEADFLAWYDREHLPALLASGAVAAARRYRCLEGEPRTLAILDLPEGAAEREAAALRAAPFRSEAIGRRVRDYHGRSYRRIAALGEARPDCELLNVIFTDVEPAHRAAFSRWYDDVHLPEIVACPGWLAARRYESVDADEHRFVAIYDLADAQRPFATPQYEAAVGWDEHVPHLRGYHGFRIYALEHAIAA